MTTSESPVLYVSFYLFGLFFCINFVILNLIVEKETCGLCHYLGLTV